MRSCPFVLIKVYPSAKHFFMKKIRHLIKKNETAYFTLSIKKGAVAPFNRLNLLMKSLCDFLQDLQQDIKLALQWGTFTCH